MKENFTRIGDVLVLI